MKRAGIFMVLFCGLALVGACKKDKNNSPVAKKLRAGKWQIVASASTLNYMGRDTTIDHYSGWRSCEQDDFMTFNKDGTGTSNENTNKCPEDEQIGNFNWELKDNDSRLKTSLNGGKFVANNSNTMVQDIVEITDTELKLRSTDSIASMPATLIETYKNIN